MNKTELFESYCALLMDQNKQFLQILQLTQEKELVTEILSLINKNNDVLSSLVLQYKKRSSPLSKKNEALSTWVLEMKFYKKGELIEEIQQQFSLNNKQFVYEEEITSINGKFIIDRWKLSQRGSSLSLQILYKVVRTDLNVRFYHDEENLSSISKAVDLLLDLIWEASPCSECYTKLVKDKYCEKCCFYHVINEHGLETKKITDTPKCTICLENVLHSKLECGHYFHLDCLLQLNEKTYFIAENKSKEFHCPNCRKEFTWMDYKKVFLYDDFHDNDHDYLDSDPEDDDDDDDDFYDNEDDDLDDSEEEGEDDIEKKEDPLI